MGNTEELYVIRHQSGYLLRGYQGRATPKLYKRGDAVRVRNLNNVHAKRNTGTEPYTIVPATLVLGEPI